MFPHFCNYIVTLDYKRDSNALAKSLNSAHLEGSKYKEKVISTGMVAVFSPM